MHPNRKITTMLVGTYQCMPVLHFRSISSVFERLLKVLLYRDRKRPGGSDKNRVVDDCVPIEARVSFSGAGSVEYSESVYEPKCCSWGLGDEGEKKK